MQENGQGMAYAGEQDYVQNQQYEGMEEGEEEGYDPEEVEAHYMAMQQEMLQM